MLGGTQNEPHVLSHDLASEPQEGRMTSARSGMFGNGVPRGNGMWRFGRSGTNGGRWSPTGWYQVGGLLGLRFARFFGRHLALPRTAVSGIT